MPGKVKVYTEEIKFPTYTVGPEDVNPIYLENRVYQGSSGAVYPYGVIDTVTGKREELPYTGIWLENDYIKILLLPQLGGRVQRAYDKVMKKDFIYFNEVIKPAMVGLLGPWISGGLEFNWPQHHRPTTFMPVDVTYQSVPEEGKETVWIGEVEPLKGLQIMTGFSLYADKALLEIKGRIFNGNDTPRHFLWWANPAVKGGDYHQSIFPPDVTAVFDHGKRDVCAFPIAKGTYYKVDYSAGVDISRYKNIPVPTSYMAEKSDYDFVGAYNHDEKVGLLHISNHHISPGKKQWTWGNCDFGQAWDRNLTDKNGPYIELMCGIYTDNQPDFSWISPYEEKVFTQNFLPYSHLVRVHNANTTAAIKLERVGNNQEKLALGVYAICELDNCTLKLTKFSNEKDKCFEEILKLKPTEVWEKEIDNKWGKERLSLMLLDSAGKTILRYDEHVITETKLPPAAQAPKMPAEINSSDECYFIGQHLEQYNHATRFPEQYYLRALEIDALDYRCNVALGIIEFNRANFAKAEEYASNSLLRAHNLNKNPHSGTGSLLRGMARERLERYDEALADYFKATWSGDCRDSAYYCLARLAMRRKDFGSALELINQSLCYNGGNNLAMGIKALAMKEKGVAKEKVLQYINSQLEELPLSYALYYARWIVTGSEEDKKSFLKVINNRGTNAGILAGWLAMGLGMEDEAMKVLEVINNEESIPLLWSAALCKDSGKKSEYLKKAAENLKLKVRFPNLIDEVQMLMRLKDDWFARYMLGCFYYSKRRYDEAQECWEYTISKNPKYAPAHRILGIHAWNKLHDYAKAEKYLKTAFELEPTNGRYLFELDCLHRLNCQSPEERLKLLSPHKLVISKRDDLTAELLNLLNIHEKEDEAFEILSKQVFHPWEGGEGKISSQYLICQMRRGINSMKKNELEKAIIILTEALKYPDNLMEGRLPGQTDNDLWFLLGKCYQQLKNEAKAKECFEKATKGHNSLEASKYYNDMPIDYLFWQGLAQRELGSDNASIVKHFTSFVDWAKNHQNDKVEPDFFAVSLPDLVTLNSDMKKKHEEHCLFVKSLGNLGLKKFAEFENDVKELLKRNPSHDKAQFMLYAFKHGLMN